MNWKEGFFMNKIILGSLSIFLLFFTSVDVKADIVFEQLPHPTPGGLYSGLGSETFPESRVYDEFTLDTSSSITGINWWGFYDPTFSGAREFTLTYYPYAADVSHTNLPTDDKELTYETISVTDWGGGVYLYSAVLTEPEILDAATYWLSIYSTDTNSLWKWQREKGDEEGEEIYGYEGTYGGAFQNLPYYATKTSNVAFQLIYETPVPIPAAAWLLGSGLIALVVIRRRTKTR